MEQIITAQRRYAKMGQKIYLCFPHLRLSSKLEPRYNFDIFLFRLLCRDDWIGYSADKNLLRLTPFQFRSPRRHLKPNRTRKLLRNNILYAVSSQVNLY